MTAPIDRRSVPCEPIALSARGVCRPRSAGDVMAFYPLGSAQFATAYGAINDHGHEIPALDLTRIDPSLLRQQVAFAGPYRPGTIVVNIAERRLYLVEPGGAAMRYAVGIGTRKRSIFAARP